ncbi:oligosaccharide flippase family protein [Roseovarius arcticus]|uniref:oligosaccharide flippase family protein n=1 Tax=Roseovarius arcticus TaxID=2547404 RepID=UPI00148728B4|nr:oligosaccharide flippase family protein [Roseovarius arcticus]
MKRYFVIGAAWSSGAAWVEQALNFLIFILIARLVGTESFGLATMAIAFTLFGEVLVRETLTEGIIERLDLKDGCLEATFVALVGFGLAVFGALLIFSQIAGVIYGEPEVVGLMIVASPTVLLISVAGVSTALLRREMAFRVLAIRSTAGVIAGGFVGLLMAVQGYGAWSLVGQRLTMTLINSVFAITAAGWLPKRLPKMSEFHLIGGLGPRVVILRAATLLMFQTPTVALGVIVGPNAVALYALSWRLVEVLLTLIVAPIKSVAQSTIASMRRLNTATDEFFLDLTQIVALAGFAGFAGLALIAHPSIEIIFGDAWRGAATIMPWICLAGAIQALSDLQESYLMAMDRTRRYLNVVMIEAVFSVGLISVASLYGAAPAAAAFALRAALFFPVRTWLALAPEKIAFADYASAARAPLLIALGMSATVVLWRMVALGRMPDVPYVASAITIGAVSCIAILVFLSPAVLLRLKSFIDAVRQT